MIDQFQEVIEHLEMLKEESGLNKNFKDKVKVVIGILNNENELPIQKALLELEELNSPIYRGEILLLLVLTDVFVYG